MCHTDRLSQNSLKMFLNMAGLFMCLVQDVYDAFEKLLRLQLKDKQERELVHVVLHCCMQVGTGDTKST